MAKRRTKSQKVNAKHSFTISWEGGLKSPTREPVKGQTQKASHAQIINTDNKTKANTTVQSYDLATIKKDIVKSLLIASFILALELVLYFGKYI